MSEYYGTWKTDELTCPKCGWTGVGDQCKQGEMFKDLYELNCPQCSIVLQTITYPTIEESRANWDKVSDIDKLMVEAREAFIDSASKAILKSPEELPEIHGDEICLIWDAVGNPTERYTTVIRHGGKEIWREPAFYEGIERYCEVVRILRAKYGRRLRDLAVAERSMLYLYGDKLTAPEIERAVRDQLWLPEGDWTRRVYECSQCGWSGEGKECVETNHLPRVFFINCPNCHGEVGEVSWLTKSELLKTGAVITNSGEIMARAHDQLVSAATGKWLEIAAQLPEVEGDELLFVWDDEETNTKRDLVIKYGEVEVWREPCFYGCYSRYPAISKILIQKYGRRLKDLIPARRSCVEYKADRGVQDARDRIVYNKYGEGIIDEGNAVEQVQISHAAIAKEEPPEPVQTDSVETDETENSDASEKLGVDDLEDDYFPFRKEEYWVIDELRKMVRDLTAIADSPETVRDLAAVQLATERLPFSTPNLHFIVLFGDPEHNYEIEISEDRFALSYGGMVGTDGYGHTVLEMETTGFRDGSTSPFLQLGEWFIDAKQLIEDGARIRVTDYEGVADLNWDLLDEDPWDLYERAMSKDPDGPFYDQEWENSPPLYPEIPSKEDLSNTDQPTPNESRSQRSKQLFQKGSEGLVQFEQEMKELKRKHGLT